MIKNIYLFVCLIIFIFLIIIIKINSYFNTIENFKYGFNCLTCASCANGAYYVDTDISSQKNGEFNYFKFVNHDDDDEKIYTFNVYTDLTCDILIIGGGGSGGGNGKWSENPGGGAGGIVYIVNQVLPTNTYKIKVGRGGIVHKAPGLTPENGHNSSITYTDDNVVELPVVMVGGPDKTIKLIGYGGGHGACFDYDIFPGNGIYPTAGDGGSGGGSMKYGKGGTSIQGNTFWDGTEFVKGGHDGENASSRTPLGGGGAGGKANVSRGGHGRQINITGEKSYFGNTLYYGGGGGGDETYGTLDGPGGDGGRGGGGSVGNTGRDGYPGAKDTGGGGGGAGGYRKGGSGGSGMIVIRYL